LIEVNAADRAFLDWKIALLDRGDLDEFGLIRASRGGSIRRRGRLGGAAFELGRTAVVDGKIYPGNKAQHRQ
jgi:hypothetical protein